MKVIIFWDKTAAESLTIAVSRTLESLGLTDFIEVSESTDVDLAKELEITKEYALVIEEESIGFKDMIFEGLTPSDDELKSMFMSIIGGGSGGWCAPGWCGSGCSC